MERREGSDRRCVCRHSRNGGEDLIAVEVLASEVEVDRLQLNRIGSDPMHSWKAGTSEYWKAYSGPMLQTLFHHQIGHIGITQ